ncbi:Ger(x)C family spore germination protein [Bacillus sp. 1P10SD]|uniref:Ger(x)C family spore germination protein n=1 Tax=Bacillus sp. 1P10SD TaxID=3132265 RepID=UPI0039A46453
MKKNRRKGIKTHFRLILIISAFVALIGHKFIVGNYIYTQTGESIPQAIGKISKYLARPTFLQNAQIIVISEKLAKSKGFLHLIDYSLREPTFPTVIKMVISKNTTPSEMMQIITPVQKMSSIRLVEMLKNTEPLWGNLQNSEPKTAKTTMLKNTKELTIPYIVVKGNIEKGASKENIERTHPEAILSLEGVGVFQNKRFSYFLSSEETQILALLNGKSQNSNFVTHCPGPDGNLNWRNEGSRPRIRMKKIARKPHLEVMVRINASLQDESCKGKLSKLSTLRTFEHQMEKDMESRFSQFIKASQKHHADFIGFGEVLYKTEPDLWKSMAPSWTKIYSKIPVHTHVNVKLTEVGETRNEEKGRKSWNK